MPVDTGISAGPSVGWMSSGAEAPGIMVPHFQVPPREELSILIP